MKVGDRLFFTIESDKKHSDNTIAVKSGKDYIVGHVPETLAKRLFNFMKSQLIEIMDSEVTANGRPALKGKWVIGGGIEISCKYRLYEPKSVKKEFELHLNDFQNSFVIIFMSFLDRYSKTPKYYDTEQVCFVNFYFLFTTIAGFSVHKLMDLFLREGGDLYSW